MPHGIQAVIFDLGRVLVQLDFSRGLLHELTGCEASGHEADVLIERLGSNPFFTEYCAGRLAPEAFHERLMEWTGRTMPFASFARSWCDIFSMDTQMEALLREVMQSSRTGLLSDTDPLHWHHLRSTYPILARIARPTLSYEVGTTKPDPAIYQVAAENVGVDPSACFFIDDREVNVEGARSVGMRATRFVDAQTLRAELRALNVLKPDLDPAAAEGASPL